MMKDRVIEKLKTIFDPEIPVDIYNLGLIYDIDVKDNKDVFITMTLTTATCPAAAYMPEEVESVVREIPGVEDVSVHIVWSPKWKPEMMSPEAQEQLSL
jgi:FeS assembly SUF system protein